ncbi:MAG: protein-L-isoaspartate(D-aspartate) O-methyltransferase [Salaquimonas sp.]|jgi:protein-L-isoaspartate(D-aspartate) O-methyltransferase|nr:protein-L-isoaspartate(D-aspartate) O-methyltransferase [Salaquimonas sp.]
MRSRREAIAGMLLRLRAMSLPHRLMMALEAVPRQNFVPVIHLDESYDRGQLPIECGQTMPGPDQVARTLFAFDVHENHRVLEIGTGTGYQTGLLATLGTKVVSLERYRTLVDKARQRLATLGIENADIRVADGREGLPGQTFDRIIVNGAYAETPRFFIDQLASGGMLIAPVGPADGVQMLTKFVKTGSRFEVSELFEVRMQPLMEGVSVAI